jgi:hypothetical protein
MIPVGIGIVNIGIHIIGIGILIRPEGEGINIPTGQCIGIKFINDANLLNFFQYFKSIIFGDFIFGFSLYSGFSSGTISLFSCIIHLENSKSFFINS